MKTALKVIGAIVVFLIVVMIALPFIINVNTFRPQIEAELTSTLGRQVQIGNMKLGFFAGSLTADDLAIADDPAFSRQPFVKAKALSVGVELIPLILSKQLNVTDLTIEEPQVSLIRNPAGKWNFSSLGGASRPSPSRASLQLISFSPANSPAKPAEAGTNANISVEELHIKDGTVSVASSTKPQVYKNVEITVKQFSLNSQFPFTLNASLPGGGTVKVDGKAGPINPADAAMTPLQASLNVKQMDLAGSGFVEPSTGIGGIANFDGTVASDGKALHTTGTVTLDKLKLSTKGTPATHTVKVNYATVYELATNTGQLTEGQLTFGQAVAHLTGTYRVEPTTTLLNMKLNADNMPVNDLVTMLPALGVVLPRGSSLQGGTLSADMAISGPTDKLVTTGPVKLANAKMVGFNFSSKLAEISQFTGGKGESGSDTTIQNFSSDVRSAPEGITTQNVNLNVPSLGLVTGTGTISPQEALNYTLNAKLGGSVGGLAKGGLPFFIQGTASDPKFVPDVKGMVNSQLGGLLGGQKGSSSPLNQLQGLFGKKK
jgi:AsmA protein